MNAAATSAGANGSWRFHVERSSTSWISESDRLFPAQIADDFEVGDPSGGVGIVSLVQANPVV